MESQATFYGVRVLNVPPGYRVQSITADKMDLASGLLNLSALPFRPRGPTYPDNSQMIAGASLSITLAASPTQTAASGVMVTGRAKSNERRSIYISGAPGIFYADGTFEFRGVPPGLHRIATVDNPGSGRPLGAAIVVGGNDLQGVELDELSLLPEDIRSPVEPRASGANPPGFAARLAVVRVAVVDPQSRESAGPGAVYVLGPLGTSFDLPPDGRFEFPGLLPGAYRVEIQPFRRPRIARTILVEDKDIDLELLVGEFEGR
jgi:hypothetical protein